MHAAARGEEFRQGLKHVFPPTQDKMGEVEAGTKVIVADDIQKGFHRRGVKQVLRGDGNPTVFSQCAGQPQATGRFTQIVLAADSRSLEARQHDLRNPHIGGTVHGGGNGLFRRRPPPASGLGGHAVLQDIQHSHGGKPDAVQPRLFLPLPPHIRRRQRKTLPGWPKSKLEGINPRFLQGLAA